MLVAGILTFSILTFAASFALGSRQELDSSLAAVVVILVAWSSLLYGLALGGTVR